MRDKRISVFQCRVQEKLEENNLLIPTSIARDFHEKTGDEATTKYCFSSRVVSLLNTNSCRYITDVVSSFLIFVSPTAARNKNACTDVPANSQREYFRKMYGNQ